MKPIYSSVFYSETKSSAVKRKSPDRLEINFKAKSSSTLKGTEELRRFSY